MSKYETIQKGDFTLRESEFKNDSFCLEQKMSDVQNLVIGLSKEDIFDLYSVISDFMIKNL